MECSICLDPLTEQPEDEAGGSTHCCKVCTIQKRRLKPGLCCTPCGHLFHRPCLELWFKSSARMTLLCVSRQSHRTCPFCRKKIDYMKLYPVYLDVNKVRKPIIDKQAETPRGNKGASDSESGSSLFSAFKRMFSRSSPSTSQQPVTQLQVAVTINCVQPSPASGPSSPSTSTASQPVEQVSVSICRDCVNNCIMQKHVDVDSSDNAPQSLEPS